MSDTDIEEIIRKLLLIKKGLNNDNNKDKKDVQSNLIKICENFHFFKKKIINNKNVKDKKIMSDILNNLEFIYLNENKIIWDIGDKVNEMYIIFLGEVNIYKPKNPDIEESQLECTLGKGYSIGEDSLKNSSNRRNYKVETKTHCILGKFISKEYLRIFNRFLYEENILINSFYKELKIFNTDFIEKFQRFSYINYYDKNQYIFKQNEPFNTFYFIYSGIVRLMVNINKTFKSKINNDILLGKYNKRPFTSSRIFEIRGIHNELINYKLIDLTVGDVIGGIEYFNKYNNYKYDIKCLTDVEVLKIDLKHFNKILIKQEIEIFKKRIKKQTEFISERIKSIKEGKEKIKLKDYILSKNKFTKTFLLNNPLSKNFDFNSELYINCPSKPIKILKIKYSKKALNNTQYSPNLIDEYEKSKNYKIKKANSIKNIISIKDFLTNIDNNKKTKVGNIFPVYEPIETIPHNHKKIYLFNDEINKNIDINKEKEIDIIKNNRTITTKYHTYLKNNKKDYILNYKSCSNSKKNTLFKSFDKNKNKKILVKDNNLNLREKLYLNYQDKKKIKSKYNVKYNSFRSFTNKKYKTLNNDEN